MKLTPNQTAPFFKTKDVFENPIDLAAYRGKKVYLAFMRNAGCAVCNLRTHELLKHAGKLASSNIRVLMVFESTVEKMKEYLAESEYAISFIADPDNKLYNQYGIERSVGKVFKSLLNGMISKAMQGKKLYKKKMSQDGHMTTIPSDFLIDEKGELQIVHYGKYVGDHIPIGELK